jgi:integrase
MCLRGSLGACSWPSLKRPRWSLRGGSAIVSIPSLNRPRWRSRCASSSGERCVRDEISIDPTDNLDLPAIRGRRDRIEPPERTREYLAALPDSERAFWSVAPFCGLRRGELRGLQWMSVDFEAGVIWVERWDPVKGPTGVKTGAGRRAVPMAFVVRRQLIAHKARTGRDGPVLVFGRTAAEVFYASTIRSRANKA